MDTNGHETLRVWRIEARDDIKLNRLWLLSPYKFV